MKKIIILNIAALLFASSAFAGATVTMSFDTTGKSLYGSKTDAATAGAAQKLIGKASTGVGVGARSTTAGYAVVAQHKSGNKIYGSSHDSTAMYMNDAVQGTVKLATPSAIGTTDFTTAAGWSTM